VPFPYLEGPHFLVETGENRTPRPEESRPEYPTGLAGVWVSPSVPPPAEYRKAQPISLWRPPSASGLPHLDIAAPSPDPSRRGRGRRGLPLGGQGELRFASYFRHRINEGDGYLGLQSRFDLPCRTLSSPQGAGESISLYHQRGCLLRREPLEVVLSRVYNGLTQRNHRR
jgi:hypothetical protein